MVPIDRTINNVAYRTITIEYTSVEDSCASIEPGILAIDGHSIHVSFPETLLVYVRDRGQSFRIKFSFI